VVKAAQDMQTLILEENQIITQENGFEVDRRYLTDEKKMKSHC